MTELVAVPLESGGVIVVEMDHIEGGVVKVGWPAQIVAEVCPELTVSQICPYRGLKPFTFADAAWFHGRDRAVHTVLAGLRRDRRFLVLLGPPGSGKSSLIHAGVLPALVRGAIPGSDCWGWLSVRPGIEPFAQLEQAGLRPDRAVAPARGRPVDPRPTGGRTSHDPERLLRCTGSSCAETNRATRLQS
jgi:hypothetical protein